MTSGTSPDAGPYRDHPSLLAHATERLAAYADLVALGVIDEGRLVPFIGDDPDYQRLYDIAAASRDAVRSLQAGKPVAPLRVGASELTAVAVRDGPVLTGLAVLDAPADTLPGDDLATVGGELGPQVANVQAFTDESRSAVETSLSAELMSAVAESVQLPRLLAVIARNTARSAGFERGSILLMSPGGRFEAAASQYADGHADVELWGIFRSRTQPFAAARTVTATGVSAAFEAPEHSDELDPETWVDPFSLKSVLVVPLVNGADPIGVLILDNSYRKVITARDIDAAGRIAAVGAGAVGLARVIHRERSSRQRAQLVLGTVVQAATQMNTTGVLTIIAEGVNEILKDSTTVSFVMENDRPGRLVVRGHGEGVIDVLDAVADDANFPDGNSALRVARTVPLEINPEFSESPVIRDLGLKRLLVIPIRRASQDLGWVISFDESQPSYADNDVRVVGALAAQAALSLHTARLLENERAAVARLEELDRLKTGFIAAVSHELRTPLTAILGFAEILAEVVEEDPLSGYVHDIRRESAVLESLIGNLLDTSRLEAGMLQLHCSETDLVGLVDEAADVVRHGFDDRLITITSDELPALHVDRVRLRQVFINLMENAAKYSPEGSPIDVTLRVEGETIVAFVDDRGQGVPNEQRDAIFDRFHRLVNHHGKPGTGIGLYLVKALVEAHGGMVGVEDRAGGGARFVVHLPIAPSGEDSA